MTVDLEDGGHVGTLRDNVSPRDTPTVAWAKQDSRQKDGHKKVGEKSGGGRTGNVKREH